MVCPAVIGSRHASRDQNLIFVLLSDNSMIYDMPVFWSRMFPGGLISVRKSELRVWDEQFMFSTEAKEEEAIIIAVSHALLADYVLPEFMFSPHSGVEIP